MGGQWRVMWGVTWGCDRGAWRVVGLCYAPNNVNITILRYFVRGLMGVSGGVGGLRNMNNARLHLGCQFTRAVGWPILLSWSVYYFSLHQDRKCHISVSEPGRNEALSTRCEEEYYIFIKNNIIYVLLIYFDFLLQNL